MCLRRRLGIAFAWQSLRVDWVGSCRTIICRYASMRGAVSRRAISRYVYLSDGINSFRVWAEGNIAWRVSWDHMPSQMRRVWVGECVQLANTICSMKCRESLDVCFDLSTAATACCADLAALRIGVSRGCMHSSIICSWLSCSPQ